MNRASEAAGAEPAASMTAQPAPSMTAQPAVEMTSRDDDIYDSDARTAASGRLADLLRAWNAVVRPELGHNQSFDGYDRQAGRDQRWHQVMVCIAGAAGSFAVLMAILQLGADQIPGVSPFSRWLAGSEYVCAVAALLAVALGLSAAFHTRWRLLRFKAEQYRFVKFHYLLHAGHWLTQTAAARLEHLRTTIAALHALDDADYRRWAQGISSIVPHDPPPEEIPDEAVVEDLVRYFRNKRLAGQQSYFSRRSHDLHHVERAIWWISPACFFLSIVFAFFHFSGEIVERLVAPAGHSSHGDSGGHLVLPAMIAVCLILAAAAPVVGAAFRTYRAAFEFGRNANRFQGVAILLKEIDEELAAARSSWVKLELLYRAEAALVSENRAWTRLMLEAEWFG